MFLMLQIYDKFAISSKKTKNGKTTKAGSRTTTPTVFSKKKPHACNPSQLIIRHRNSSKEMQTLKSHPVIVLCCIQE